LDFSCLVSSRDPNDRMCSLAIDVTTAMSGLSIQAYPSICPGPPTAVSMTAYWDEGVCFSRFLITEIL